MEQHNYYAAPAAAPVADFAYGTDAILATRLRRFCAYLLDSSVFFVAFVPMLILMIVGFASDDFGLLFLEYFDALLYLGVFISFVIVVINCYLLSESGQTIGKRILGIKIVRSDLVTPAGFWRIVFFRFLSIWALGLIPFIGSFVQLGNYLMIFGEERRCGHDLIADTHVINVNAVVENPFSESLHSRHNPYSPPERHYTPPSNQDVPPAW